MASLTTPQKCVIVARHIAKSSKSLPAGLTDLIAQVSFYGFESNLIKINHVLTAQNPIKQNPTEIDASDNSFLNVALNLVPLHDFIEQKGEASITKNLANWYCKHINHYPVVKALIMTEEQKARIAHLNKVWMAKGVKANFESVENRVGKEKLPEKNKRNIMITSALPYVNNYPHLGNLIGCVLSADCVARYFRSRNYNSIYICGTDEYGTATEIKALSEGLTCKEICDKYHTIHKECYKWFNISFDHFGRTSTPKQTEITHEIFNQLKSNGKLMEKECKQLYDPIADMFLADRFVEGTCPKPECGYEDARGDQCDGCGGLMNPVDLINPRSRVEVNGKKTGATPIEKMSKHQFIKLDEVSPDLEKWLENGIFKDEKTSKNTKAIARKWLKMGLQARCITRDLKWGTEIPLDDPEYKKKVFYVWFDAPIGYLSITASWTENWRQWWQNPENVEYFSFMAKDNVPFHSIVFPSTLLGTGKNWTQVTSLCATEYLNYENGKFSKSRNVGVFGNNAQDTGIDSDYWRFYLLFVRPEEKDSEFNWNDFQSKVNSDLLNNLGNFCNRPLNLVAKFWNGVIPEWEFGLESRDMKLVQDVDDELQTYIKHFELSSIREALRTVLRISALGNGYLQELQPWKIRKADDKRAGQIVSMSLQLVALIVVLIEPFMPETSKKIADQLGFEAGRQYILPEQFLPIIAGGHSIGKPMPLIQKITDEEVADFRVRYAGKGEEKK
jgi:methionyl-tRNA synthetase